MSHSALVDTTNDDNPGNVDALKKDLAEAVTAKPEATDAPDPQVPDEPDKYRGKSREQIMEMHQNAERKIGQTGNELGQYKQLTDQLLNLKRRDDLAKGGAEPEEEEEPLPKITQTEILDDPDAAISKAVEARLSRAERKRERQEAKTQEEQLQAQFEERHPDAEEIGNSPEFLEFVNKSPSRQMLANAVAQTGNVYAANVLLDEFKAAKEVPAEESLASNDPIKEAKKAATLSTGASNVKDTPTGKTYRRLDLIRLKLEDPEAYGSEEFQREIMQAYAEGRVK